MRKALIYTGAGLLAIASSIGIETKLEKSSYETRQNAPQADRVLELEEELFKLTGRMKSREALEKYANDLQFRESYNSLTNEYNSLIEQPNIPNASSSIKNGNALAGFNGMLFGAGAMSTGFGLTFLAIGLKNKRKKNQ